MTARTRPLIAALLVLTSILLALVAAEVAYRIYLGSRPFAPAYINYQAVQTPTSVFDAEAGYHYVPDKAIPMATVVEGQVVGCNVIRTNAEGNIGPAVHASRAGATRILVVGDSFSDNMQLGGTTWPELLAARLQADTARPVEVLNYSRSGFGILQMVTMARIQAEKQQPDLIIIPFILHDLTRARFWRTGARVDGIERLLQLPTPSTDPSSLQSAMDVSLVDPGVDEPWCRRQLERRETADPLLQALNERFRQFAIDSHRSIRLWTLSKVFLYDRIVHQDYSGRFARQHILGPLEITDFTEDPGFVEDVAALKALNVPVRLIRLPLFEELKANRYEPPVGRQVALLRSLERSLDTGTTGILPLPVPVADPEEDYLLPHDLHPSNKGIALYADLIAARLLGESGELPGKDAPAR